MIPKFILIAFIILSVTKPYLKTNYDSDYDSTISAYIDSNPSNIPLT